MISIIMPRVKDKEDRDLSLLLGGLVCEVQGFFLFARGRRKASELEYLSGFLVLIINFECFFRQAQSSI